jgi:hypothetical protein
MYVRTVSELWSVGHVRIVGRTQCQVDGCGSRLLCGKLGRNNKTLGQCLLWAVRHERPKHLGFNSFRNCQRIFKFDTQVSYRAVHLRMPQQKLDGAQVARLL